MSSSVVVAVAGVPLAFAEKTFSSLFDCDHTTVASLKADRSALAIYCWPN